MSQQSLFDPAPCRSCGGPVAPRWLPNYEPPVWVIGHGPRCGGPIYAPTCEAVVMDWNRAEALPLQDGGKPL